MFKNEIKQNEGILNKINHSLIGIISRNFTLIFIIVSIIGFLIRLYYTPFDIPITLDGLRYFWYALDTSILGHYPTDYFLANTGWPTLLSIFFSFYHSSNFLDYMIIQRLASVIISSLTVIPVYFLISKFFDKPSALIGSSLFIFEPRVIQNSLFGLTDSLFIFLSTLGLVFFLKKNIKSSYLAFFIIALATFVRYEGLLLVIPFSIIFFIKHKNEKKLIIKFLISVTIFLLVLTPIAIISIDVSGKDGLTSHIISGSEFVYYTKISQDDAERCREGDCNETLFDFALRGIRNFIKTTGIALVPNFIFFLPACFFLIRKKRDYKKNTLILFSIVVSLPILYAYARNLIDVRYLFILFPIFSLISVYFIKKIILKNSWNGILYFVIIGIIIVVSIIILNNYLIDYEREKEFFAVANWIIKNTDGVNDFHEIEKYHSVATVAQNPFPALRSEFIKHEPLRLDSSGFNSLNDYIKFGEKNGLTHIVVDGYHNKEYFNDIFFNEEKYPYLIKEYDSIDYDFQYQVKIYKIDYGIFDSISNELE